MDLWDAVFQRKTVDKYLSKPISEKMLKEIKDQFAEISDNFEWARIEMVILSGAATKSVRTGLFGPSAPYYMLFYCDPFPRYSMNTGVLMQQMSLFMTTLGLGSTYLYRYKADAEISRKGKKILAGVLAFGYSKSRYLRNKNEADRKPISQLCIFKEEPKKWVSQLLEAARFAPSFLNEQPWRFLVYEDRIHIYSSKKTSENMSPADELNFGFMFANIITAAEVLWLDVDLIRLDELDQNDFTQDRYVISAIMKENFGVEGDSAKKGS